MRRRRFILLLAATGLGTSRLAPGVGSTSAEPIVAATLIAKFKGDAAIGRLAQSVMEGAPLPAGELEALLQPVGASVGVPLRPVRVASGGELVLQIPRRQALEQLAGHLKSKEGVQGVTRLPDPSPNPFRIDDRIRVAFAPGSRHADMPAADAGPPAAEEISTLVESLLAGTPYVAAPAIRPGGVLELAIDWGGVTRQVVAALRNRDDIEYVQVEQMLVPFE